jgi:hypothetical protein
MLLHEISTAPDVDGLPDMSNAVFITAAANDAGATGIVIFVVDGDQI